MGSQKQTTPPGMQDQARVRGSDDTIYGLATPQHQIGDTRLCHSPLTSLKVYLSIGPRRRLLASQHRPDPRWATVKGSKV
ncbi:hypothetical protein EVAR_46825_1 [Eumeta japonica]|uniref:Uncharacterized protein n=1 Tax=Eumeta variegata TaxID=151549 RepID=A0A4C1ZQU4_EUMVA|nr:hypothetical protein EVAR_46825_1 [Eumeta japonica]